jgi:ribonuclease P protein component
MKKENRIIKGVDFKRVYSARKSSHHLNLTVSFSPNGLPVARLGLSVSTKVGKAVVRNRIKRVFRAAFDSMLSELPTGYDFVVVPKKGYVDHGMGAATAILLTARASARLAFAKELRKPS